MYKYLTQTACVTEKLRNHKIEECRRAWSEPWLTTVWVQMGWSDHRVEALVRIEEKIRRPFWWASFTDGMQWNRFIIVQWSNPNDERMWKLML